jgi:hypothetical protein
MTITLQTEGRRVYLLGNTYPVKDRIKAGGGKYDPERKAWYVGVQRRELAAQLAGQASATLEKEREKEREDGISLTANVIRGRAEYKGKTYYILAHGHSRDTGAEYAKLCSRDGKMVFWASKEHMSTLEILKIYKEPTSIQSLRDYADRMKDARGEFGGDDMCAECGARRATTTASDSSGITAGVCGRCASMSQWERSFA